MSKDTSERGGGIGIDATSHRAHNTDMYTGSTRHNAYNTHAGLWSTYIGAIQGGASIIQRWRQ